MAELADGEQGRPAGRPRSPAADAPVEAPAGRPPLHLRRDDDPATPDVPAGEPFTFQAVARLELDDLLEQLIARASDVLRSQGRLRALLRATQALSVDLDVPALLGRTVDEARTLMQARYAALGVFSRDGQLTSFVHSGVDSGTVAAIGRLPEGKGLLGQLMRDPAPLRLRDLSLHPSFSGFPAGHPPMRSFLAVPIRVRDRLFGSLYVTDKLDGEEFSFDDEELVVALARAAATAIDNARLFDTVARREHWLDSSRALTNALMSVADRDEALQLITRSLRETARADFAAVVVPADGGGLAVAAADGPGADAVRGQCLPADTAVGRSIRERVPVLVDDARDLPDVPGPIRALGLGPLGVVPLSARDRVLGALAIGNGPGGAVFTSHDLAMAGDFAAQAALVLLVSAAQAAARELELGDERARIARDLHDHAIQAIFAVGLSLNGLATRIDGRESDALVQLVEQLDEAVRSIRRSIFALQRPMAPGQPQLRSQLADLVAQESRALGFHPQLRTDGALESAVSPAIADDILAVVREALSNIVRHAHARHAEVTVAAGDDLVVLVRDDGRGIGAPARVSGVANMRARAAAHGGRCAIVAAPEGGTVVRWVVPLTMAAATRSTI